MRKLALSEAMEQFGRFMEAHVVVGCTDDVTGAEMSAEGVLVDLVAEPDGVWAELHDGFACLLYDATTMTREPSVDELWAGGEQ